MWSRTLEKTETKEGKEDRERRRNETTVLRMERQVLLIFEFRLFTSSVSQLFQAKACRKNVSICLTQWS